MGAAADHPTTRFAIRTMAGRDLALGLGTLRALDQDEGARTWVLAGALVDGVGAAASLLACATWHWRAFGTIVAGCAAAAGAVASDRLG